MSCVACCYVQLLDVLKLLVILMHSLSPRRKGRRGKGPSWLEILEGGQKAAGLTDNGEQPEILVDV